MTLYSETMKFDSIEIYTSFVTFLSPLIYLYFATFHVPRDFRGDVSGNETTRLDTDRRLYLIIYARQCKTRICDPQRTASVFTSYLDGSTKPLQRVLTPVSASDSGSFVHLSHIVQSISSAPIFSLFYVEVFFFLFFHMRVKERECKCRLSKSIYLGVAHPVCTSYR